MPTPLHFLKKPLLVLALGLGACSAEQHTQTDSRPGVNLTQYKTYNFMDAVARNDSAFQNSSSNIFDVKRAVTRELAARGFQQSDKPDLWVNLGLVTQQRVQTRETNFRQDGAPYYIGQRNYHWQAGEVATGTYQDGTVTIELVDAARKELVWQGTTTSILSQTPSRAAKQIDKGVADVFARFPVPAR
ncbi:DUF4136 domain-containing protein [Hymenobacter sp. HMF4947]|uniref:DUF4136 domain-containing protein n=1 Tax=Hymenobacter ginkgonis TaxID=2682976 RepID=A0A7K1TDS9_9BACT|nr:DUF4136 domain-containing protein [Hymenobacter ginkgonis]MVN76557.1 DUF4136 domain-containing protein [Hymenobacter ginkgonis]